jgi:hypothetical protein
MSGRLTVLTSKLPTTLGKKFSLDANGQLVKETSGNLSHGYGTVREFDNATELGAILEGIGTDQAIMASLPRDRITAFDLVTKSVLEEHPGALSRSKEHFAFPPEPGIFILDYDPPQKGIAMTRDHLWSVLKSVVPGIGEASVVWWCSGSSYIFDGARELAGLKGQRFYILVNDLSDTDRFGAVLQARLWLAGYGRIEISKSGQNLLRTIADAAMAQPARLDFIGGAVCLPPLEQRRGMPVIISDGGWLDTTKYHLSPKEDAAFAKVVADAKTEAEPESLAAKSAWQEGREKVALLKMIEAGVDPVQARDRVKKSIAMAIVGVLNADFDITLDDGEVVTVGDLLADPDRYDKRMTLDPMEPEYDNSKLVGHLNLKQDSPTLYSHAHGGQTYLLKRQLATLQIVKGGRADLVDGICEVLEVEPDVFVKGGLPVQIRDGKICFLNKAGLLYVLESRIAFTKRNAKGETCREDLPDAIADMLMAQLRVVS